MATVAPPSDQAADLLQKLSLDSQQKSLELPEPTKKTSGYSNGSTNSINAANGQNPSYEHSVTPFQQDFTSYSPNGYPSTTYYYGGYDGRGSEWDGYARYMNPDGVDMTSGVYGDNGHLMYQHGYGYASYGPYSPAGSPLPTVGNDGQLYAPQHYQYPSYFQPPTSTSGPFSSSASAPSMGTADQKPLSVDTTSVNSNGVVNSSVMEGKGSSASLKPTNQNSSSLNNSHGRGALSGGIPQDPRFGFSELYSSVPRLDAPIFSDGQQRPVTSTAITSFSKGNNSQSFRNQNIRPNAQFMGLHHPRPISGIGNAHSFTNRIYPNKLYGQYANTGRFGMSYGSGGYDSRVNGRGWLAFDGKYKPRLQGNNYFGYGNENTDGLNELNKGPRSKGSKNQKGFSPLTLEVKGQNTLSNEVSNEEKDAESVIHNQENYNRADFPDVYTAAKFFVIKSYSEDDVHKSIKYNVWASTPNGNKKLDAAYQEAQQKHDSCAVFLFFSVNTSGQFVGLAEMVGPVDFDKSVKCWQQDKWTGCFPVKWHIVKDVPNSLLRHITLENNENKPVTNSRDTQEVKLEQGLEMVKIFKNHTSKTCILDDFGFYEEREKTIQEKKAKQQQLKPVDEKKQGGNVAEKLEMASDLINEATSNDELKLPENVSAAKTEDVIQDAKAGVSSVKALANGC